MVISIQTLFVLTVYLLLYIIVKKGHFNGKISGKLKCILGTDTAFPDSRTSGAGIALLVKAAARVFGSVLLRQGELLKKCLAWQQRGKKRARAG